jgi:CRISPR system Cascade subunit CasB
MTEPNPFIQYLEDCREDRATLASLRRGLGQPAGSVPEVSRIVQRRLALDAEPWVEAAYYLIAPLFALHPDEGGAGNMGNHFRDVCEPGQDLPPNVERRFMALLASDPADLDDVLRQAVTLLKSKSVPVNWHELVRDVLDWKHPNEERRTRVQRKWSRAFWRTRPPAPATDFNPTTNS